MREPERHGKDFLLAVADLNRLLRSHDGRIVRVAVNESTNEAASGTLTGKVLWWHDGEAIQEYIVHGVTWRYPLDGIHRGVEQHVSLSSGDYYVVGTALQHAEVEGDIPESREAQLLRAYTAAIERFNERT